jgi:hypothetical protein
VGTNVTERPQPPITDPDLHLTSLEGWRQFVADPPHIELSSPDEARIEHHSRLPIVATTTIDHTVTCGRRLVLLNRHAIGARRGMMLSGPASTGKTIAITQLGRAHELLDRARHPTVRDRIPTLYITLPPAATARMIAAEFARFLGLPVKPRANLTDIIEAVVGVCTDARTGLVLIDELHNISPTTRNGAEVADTLKYFSERIPATFVYAGINLEDGVLSGTRGAQISGRFALIPTRPYPYGPEWRGLVAGMENALLLHQHPPGSLSAIDRLLHTHTNGMIGALAHALRGAAIDAILSGTEQVTAAGIKAIPLDLAVRTGTAPAGRKPR